jgi:DNA-binding NarL/FixJ family response regulator
MQLTSTRQATGTVHRILVVDDHPIIRMGLVGLIEQEPGLEICGETEHAAQAIQIIANSRPDLVIIDISLKDIDGIELIKQIRSRCGPVKMLVSSMHEESLYAERALRAGAQGYITKDEPPEKLIDAIHKILAGKIYLSKGMSDYLLNRVATGEDGGQGISMGCLSDRELEIFELIGRGLTTRQIATRLHRSIKTIETYRQHLKRKLKLKNSTELVRHAVKWQMEHA